MAATPGQTKHVEFVKGVTLAELLPSPNWRTELVLIDSEATLEEASLVLAKNSLLSAPVFDKAAGKYVGLLDIFDLVAFVVFSPILDSAHQKEEEEYFKYKAQRWKKDTVGDLLRGQHQVRRNIHLCHPGETLDTLMEALSRGGAHRGLLFEKGEGGAKFSKDPIHLFTQSNIIAFLQKNQDKLGHILQTRLEELGLVNPEFPSKELITISNTETALAGFTKVFENRKSHAVAVVDAERRLIANISASDLRGITSEALPQLLLNVEEFLRKRAGSDSESNNRLQHPVTCSSRATIGELLDSIVTAKVHRVWVVDSAQRPLRAITLEDILHALLAPE